MSLSQHSSVRAIEDQAMTPCAASKGSLSIAHSSPTALAEPSDPWGRLCSRLLVHHVSHLPAIVFHPF